MTKLFEQAIEAARALSPKEQNALAHTILGFIQDEAAVYVLSDEERAAIEEGTAQADRGDFASEVEAKALFARFRQ